MSLMNVNRITWKPISITVKHLETEADRTGAGHTPRDDPLVHRDTLHLVLNEAENKAVGVLGKTQVYITNYLFNP